VRRSPMVDPKNKSDATEITLVKRAFANNFIDAVPKR